MREYIELSKNTMNEIRGATQTITAWERGSKLFTPRIEQVFHNAPFFVNDFYYFYNIDNDIIVIEECSDDVNKNYLVGTVQKYIWGNDLIETIWNMHDIDSERFLFNAAKLCPCLQNKGDIVEYEKTWNEFSNLKIFIDYFPGKVIDTITKTYYKELYHLSLNKTEGGDDDIIKIKNFNKVVEVRMPAAIAEAIFYSEHLLLPYIFENFIIFNIEGPF